MTSDCTNNISENKEFVLDSVEDLENKLSENPDSANLRYNLALALVRSKQWDRAESEFRAALKLKPGMLEARVNIAGMLLQKGNYDGCIEESLKALEFRPDLVEACVNIGIAFSQKGMLDQAEKSFEKAAPIPRLFTSMVRALGEDGEQRPVREKKKVNLDDLRAALEKSLSGLNTMSEDEEDDSSQS